MPCIPCKKLYNYFFHKPNTHKKSTSKSNDLYIDLGSNPKPKISLNRLHKAKNTLKEAKSIRFVFTILVIVFILLCISVHELAKYLKIRPSEEIIIDFLSAILFSVGGVITDGCCMLRRRHIIHSNHYNWQIDNEILCQKIHTNEEKQKILKKQIEELERKNK